MKLINQSARIVHENNPYKLIEIAGRVSHKSEERITDGSYVNFFLGMLKIGHTATLEFGDVYLEINQNTLAELDYDEVGHYFELLETGKYCPYCKSIFVSEKNTSHYIGAFGTWRIYTNLRFILDQFPNVFEDFVNDNLPEGITKFIPKNDDPYKRYCFNIITNRGISHEVVRHRVFSFLQESTRYVKYGGDMEIIIPDNFGEFDVDVINVTNPAFVEPQHLANMDEDSIQWHKAIKTSEEVYQALITDSRWKPQIARGVLPNDLKTEMYITGYLKDWIGHTKEKHVLNVFGENIEVVSIKGFDTLRNDVAAHPQARELAQLVATNIQSLIGTEKFVEIKNNHYV